MRDTTTIRILPATRDALRDLAAADGVTLDEELTRLLRAERQRRMGLALAVAASGDDRPWLEMGVATVRDHAGR